MYRTRTNPLDTLFRAALALTASALVFLAVLVVYSQRSHPDAAVPPGPLVILGKSLQTAVGSAAVTGDALKITGYEAQGGELVAVALWRGRIVADDYPFLQYQVDTDFPGPALKLVWYTQENPGVLKSADLQATDGDPAWLDLSRHPDWNGSVVQIGVVAYTSDGGDALSISHLTLEPQGWRAGIASYWSALTAYRGWTARSINKLYGSSDATVLSPVLVAAGWSALAVILLLVSGLLSRMQAGALCAALLLPWLALDMLWQRELLAQLAQTREQFAGRTVEEKHLVDVDRHIYRYITRLKEEVLPQQPARVLLLHNSRTHNFDRLKAQYYLLPHNVYNFGLAPPERGLQSIDYVLVLGELRHVRYDAATRELVWRRGKRSLPVELIDEHFMGRLYRVLPRSSGAGADN